MSAYWPHILFWIPQKLDEVTEMDELVTSYAQIKKKIH